MSGLSDPRAFFGVHSVSPYRRTDGMPYGIAKVVGEFSANFSGDLVELRGGSSPYPYGVEGGAIKADLAVTFREYADWIFTLFLGQAPTVTGSDSSGTISALTNIKGTSCFDATTGVASIDIIASTGKNNLKFGKYLLIVASSSTVDIYNYSDADFARGSAGSYLDDSLKIASGVSVTSGASTDETAWGFKVTGGSGTIGMTVGDSASFEVMPPSSKGMSVVVGGSSSTYPEFGCVVMAQRRGDSSMCEIDIFRCKAIGAPIGFKEKAWSEAQIKATALFDSTQNGVYKLRQIVES